MGTRVRAERVGFEPTDPGGSAVFKTAAFVHSATAPKVPLAERRDGMRCDACRLEGDSFVHEWRAWFESWQLTLEVQGRRPQTIEFYRGELFRFADHVDTPPLLVTKPMVRAWMKTSIDAGLSANAVGNARGGGQELPLLVGRER
jgi:hypothetical protein